MMTYPKNRKSRQSKISKGYRSGRLLVIRKTNRQYRGCWLWECLCDCGKTHEVPTNRLTNKKTKSCGCLKKTMFSKDNPFAGKNKRDITGKKFNRLLVIKDSGERKCNNVVWLCKCDCGNICKVRGYKITSGHTKSCGCYQQEIRRESGLKTKNLTSPGGPLIYNLMGEKFNKLTVIKRAPRRNQEECGRWLCKCDCGNHTIIDSTHLRTGKIKSCGCIRRKLPLELYNLPPGKRYSKALTNGYIKATLMAHNSGIKVKNISPEMIELKRQQIIMIRTLKQFKQWRCENESNCQNGHG